MLIISSFFLISKKCGASYFCRETRNENKRVSKRKRDILLQILYTVYIAIYLYMGPGHLQLRLQSLKFEGLVKIRLLRIIIILSHSVSNIINLVHPYS